MSSPTPRSQRAAEHTPGPRKDYTAEQAAAYAATIADLLAALRVAVEAVALSTGTGAASDPFPYTYFGYVDFDAIVRDCRNAIAKATE